MKWFKCQEYAASVSWVKETYNFKMEEAYSLETLVNTYQTSVCHIPDNGDIQMTLKFPFN
jgi:hypothetical protein